MKTAFKDWIARRIVGEVLFYQAYRDCGLGLRLRKQIEEHVRVLGSYRFLTCATLMRPDNHHLCPVSYVQIDRFLDRTGFVMLPGVATSFAWKETDGISRDHPIQFWIKVLF